MNATYEAAQKEAGKILIARVVFWGGFAWSVLVVLRMAIGA